MTNISFSEHANTPNVEFEVVLIWISGMFPWKLCHQVSFYCKAVLISSCDVLANVAQANIMSGNNNTFLVFMLSINFNLKHPKYYWDKFM